MAVYKIFPEKDASIYSGYPKMNTGRDPILEISNLNNDDLGIDTGVTRTLIKFSDSEINNVLDNVAGNPTSYSASLKLFLAKGEQVNTDYTVESYVVSGAWDMGRGMYEDNPQSIDGVSWIYRKAGETNAWLTSSFSTGVTGSFPTASIGGGNWYTSSVASQSFSYNDSSDVNINITNHIAGFRASTYTNEGHIVKLSDTLEDSDTYQELRYFSMDTHTVYPPVLEIKWRDYSYDTGSNPATVINTAPLVVTFDNNQYEYSREATERFRVNARPQYPTRVFTTSSVYLTNHYLPTASYYQVVDAKTKEVVIDFDNEFTQISADETSNYFDLHMNGLQPERYYTVNFKTTVDGSTKVISGNSTFKVVNL